MGQYHLTVASYLCRLFMVGGGGIWDMCSRSRRSGTTFYSICQWNVLDQVLAYFSLLARHQRWSRANYCHVEYRRFLATEKHAELTTAALGFISFHVCRTSGVIHSCRLKIKKLGL